MTRPPGRRGGGGRGPRIRKGRGRSKSDKGCALLVFAFVVLPVLIAAVIVRLTRPLGPSCHQA